MAKLIEITKKSAIEIFTGLSFNDCASWEGEKWGKRIAKLPALLSGPDALSTLVGNNTDAEVIKTVKEYRAAIKADPTTTFGFVAKTPAVGAGQDNIPAKVKATAPVVEVKKTKVVEQKTIPEVERAVKAAAKTAAPAEKPKAKAAVEKKITKGVPYEERFKRLTDDPDAFKATGGTDKFGFRNGTMSAAVNAQLSENFITTDKIAAKVKNVQRYRITDHMWKMRKLGFAESDAANTQHKLTAKGLKADFSKEAPAPKAKKIKEVKPVLAPKEALKVQIQATLDKAKKTAAKVAVKAEIKKVEAAKKPAPKAKVVAKKAPAPVKAAVKKGALPFKKKKPAFFAKK